jgi:hypothetical protein
MSMLNDRKTEIEEIEKYGLPISKMEKTNPCLFTEAMTQ